MPSMPPASHLTQTTGYLLSKLGGASTERFSSALESLGLRPKHCGLLAAVQAWPMASQQMLGRALGLVPSAIVAMMDDLEAMDAIQRVPANEDRRRYGIVLTAQGQSLLKRATTLARRLDDALLDPLSEQERRQLNDSLGKLAAVHLKPAP